MEQLLLARSEKTRESVQFISLKEKKTSRIYSFIDFDEKRGLYIHKQLENRNGKILMRSKVRKIVT